MTLETAPATEAPAADAPDAKPQEGDVLDVILEGMDKPTRIPLEKVKPDLAKFRAEADRKLSEADRRGKEADAREGKYKSLAAKMKSDPSAFAELAKDIGLDEETIDAMSEARVAAKLQKAMREYEEGQHPEKKAERETKEQLEKLTAERDELRSQQDTQRETAKLQRAEGLVVSVLDKLGPAARNVDVAQEVVWTLRQMVSEHEAKTGEPLTDIADLGDALSPDNIAKRTAESWGRRVARYYETHPEADIPESVLKRAEALIDKKRATAPKHPAAEGKGGTVKNGTHRNDLKAGEEPRSTAVLMKYLRL